MPYRVGIIGLGFAGASSPDSHLRAYQDCLDTYLVALCDKEEWKADVQIDEDAEIELTTSSYWDMLNLCYPDIVSVCTPVETHCQIVCDIAPYVKAINCEKPIATTLKEADRMIETCQEHSVILQVNHQRRFAMPVMRWSRGLLNNGSHAFDLIRQIGALGKVQMEYVDTEDYIFELDIFSDPKPSRLTLKGVEHLVDCLKNSHQSISSGEEARETLREVLEHGDKSSPRA